MRTIARPDTVTDAAANQIKAAIVSGEYSPGAALSEVALAGELGVSRGTVREAIRTLENGGLVIRDPRKGLFVAALTRERVQETFTLRACLESFAARLAVEHKYLTSDAMAEIEQAYEDLRRAIHGADSVTAAEADLAFHEKVSQQSHHQLLLQHLSMLRDHTRRFITFSNYHKADRSPDVELHRGLIDALQTNDPLKAEAAFRDHVLDAGHRLLDTLEDPA